jgi:uncharacterized protein (TIGR02145 family)
MLISNSDGALIRQSMDNGDSVVVFMGKKTGYYLNDIGIDKGSVIRPTEYSIPASQALNAGEYLFRLGAVVKNYGQNSQSNLSLNVKIDFTNPAGLTNTVYNQNVTLATLASDSTDTLRTLDFDPSAFRRGRYNISYTINMPAGITDQFPADNTVNQGFEITTNLISKVRLDSLGNMLYSGGVRPSDATAGPYDFGIWYYANKGSRLKVDSIRFSFVTNPGSDLFNESIVGKVSQWLDLNQDGMVDAGEIVALAEGIYTYTDTSGSNSQRSVLVTDIINNTPGVILADSSIYLFSAYYSGSQTTVFTNVDPQNDYTLTRSIYQQFISPVLSGTWNPNGIGPNRVPAVSAVISNVLQTQTSLCLPTITTSTPTSIGIDSVVIGGDILNDGGSSIVLRGVCFSTTPNPNMGNLRTEEGSGIGSFTSTLRNLSPSTTYYARSYAKNSQGVVVYGNEVSFSTGTPIPGVRCPGTPSVTDIDGNLYHTVQIGTQCWTQSNLKVSKYRNGDNILTGLSNTAWENTTGGSYAIYNNDPVNDGLYGKLYNHYAVLDTRGLCPTGWHVPSDGEWMQLVKYLDPNADTICSGCVQSGIAGGALKSAATQPTPGGWNSPNMGASNSSGFTAVPGGQRHLGFFFHLGNYGDWWTSSHSQTFAWNRYMGYNLGVGRDYKNRTDGFSIRCLKD